MKKTLFLFVLVFCFACTSSNLVRLSPTVRQPIPLEMVAVYEYESQVESEFEKVAVITVKGSSLWKTKEGLLKKLKEKAGSIGANAIILSTSKKTSAGVVALDAWFTAGLLSKKQYSAVAIYIHPENK